MTLCASTVCLRLCMHAPNLSKQALCRDFKQVLLQMQFIPSSPQLKTATGAEFLQDENLLDSEPTCHLPIVWGHVFSSVCYALTCVPLFWHVTGYMSGCYFLTCLWLATCFTWWHVCCLCLLCFDMFACFTLSPDAVFVVLVCSHFDHLALGWH